MTKNIGWCVWMTGLPGSGKSVISRNLVKLLGEKSVAVQVLSSDELRKVLTPKPTYSLEEREVVYSTIVYIAKLLTENGVNVIIDATGNLRKYRDNARASLQRFVEVYLDCPLEVCMQREAARKNTYSAPKGIYADAAKGKTATVPGMGQPYEPPLKPEVTVKNARISSEEAAKQVLKFLLGLNNNINE